MDHPHFVWGQRSALSKGRFRFNMRVLVQRLCNLPRGPRDWTCYRPVVLNWWTVLSAPPPLTDFTTPHRFVQVFDIMHFSGGLIRGPLLVSFTVSRGVKGGLEATRRRSSLRHLSGVKGQHLGKLGLGPTSLRPALFHSWSYLAWLSPKSAPPPRSIGLRVLPLNQIRVSAHRLSPGLRGPRRSSAAAWPRSSCPAP